MDYPTLGVDISVDQGHPDVAGLPGSFVICNASRANVGLVVGSDYVWQADAVRAADKELGHYFFNGNIDVAECAAFFVANLHDYRKGDALVLDVEAEKSTHTVAWNPGQVLEFAQSVFAALGAKAIVYLNESEMISEDWSQVVAFGCPLWLAWPNGSLPAIKYWSHASIWQYTSTGNLDQNKATGTLASITGVQPAPAPEEEDDDMAQQLVLICHKNSNGTHQWALTGPGYWADIYLQSTANLLNPRFNSGAAPIVSDVEWQAFRVASGIAGAAPTT